jgi:hypothetical protein
MRTKDNRLYFTVGRVLDHLEHSVSQEIIAAHTGQLGKCIQLTELSTRLNDFMPFHELFLPKMQLSQL